MTRYKVAAGMAVVWLACLVLARAADVPPFDPSLPAQSRCVVAIEAVRPTQFAVGYREVEERAQNIVGKSPKKFKKYMEEHLPLLVVGPGGVPYLIDGHHLALALLNHRVTDRFEARIEANWRGLSPADFWKKMQQHGWVYLYDNKGQGPLSPDRLPRKVTGLTDDPYRALAWEVRERGIPQDQCVVRRIPMGQLLPQPDPNRIGARRFRSRHRRGAEDQPFARGQGPARL